VALTSSTDRFRQFDRLSLVARQPARAGTGGEHVSRRPAPSTDFVDYRPYQPGDDFRRVDWNVYGRLGSLQVKVTEGRERLDVFLVLDCSGSMGFGNPGKLEFAAELVGALAYVGTARADTVRIGCLGLPEDRFGPFSRRARVPEVVRQLSAMAPAGLVDLNVAIRDSLSEASSRNQMMVVVSDLLTRDSMATLLDGMAGRVPDVAVVHVISPQELDPRLSGEVELVDSESGETIEMGVSLDTLSAYRDRFTRWLDDRATQCRSRGWRYVCVHTDRALASVVLDDLRRGGILK
jgi:uncharacterized protein (DUF58 family)